MASNLDRYRADLDRLIGSGENLFLAIHKECFPDEFEKKIKKVHKEKAKEVTVGLPIFADSYQSWYSEAKALVRQLLPDRVGDFASHYERPKSRKSATVETYRIEDYLQGLRVARTIGFESETVVGPDAAIPQFRQQLAILNSVKKRFESSLFDIRQLAQADLFDSELDAAYELANKKFGRAAGALAGVVLEPHLAQVCRNHAVKLTKKDPTIGDLNDALKLASTVDVPQWRFIQHLADLRNLCDHNKSRDPSHEQVSDLLEGVRKITKTLY